MWSVFISYQQITVTSTESVHWTEDIETRAGDHSNTLLASTELTVDVGEATRGAAEGVEGAGGGVGGPGAGDGGGDPVVLEPANPVCVHLVLSGRVQLDLPLRHIEVQGHGVLGLQTRGGGGDLGIGGDDAVPPLPLLLAGADHGGAAHIAEVHRAQYGGGSCAGDKKYFPSPLGRLHAAINKWPDVRCCASPFLTPLVLLRRAQRRTPRELLIETL